MEEFMGFMVVWLFLLGLVLIFFGVALALWNLIRSIFYLIKNRAIFARNQRANYLARKARGGLDTSDLTPEELAEFNNFCSSGVLKHSAMGVLRVSDEAWDEQWQ